MPMEILKKTSLLLQLLLVAMVLVLAAENGRGGAEETDEPPFVLSEAVMCEDVSNEKPVNPTIVFSVSRGRVFCYTGFDKITNKSTIYHNWIRKDEPIKRVKLFLSPPRWATFSSIHLREGDRGPWRVEITDQDENILHVLRFSIVE